MVLHLCYAFVLTFHSFHLTDTDRRPAHYLHGPWPWRTPPQNCQSLLWPWCQIADDFLLQALVKSYPALTHANHVSAHQGICMHTRGIIFFGTPDQGASEWEVLDWQLSEYPAVSSKYGYITKFVYETRKSRFSRLRALVPLSLIMLIILLSYNIITAFSACDACCSGRRLCELRS